MTRPRLAYVCSDRGIRPDGVKGASIHFREFGRALAATGVGMEIFMSRAGRGELADLPIHTARSRAKGDGAVAEIRALADNAAMLDILEAHGPFDAVYERYSLFGLAGSAYAQSRDIPFVLEVNAPLWLEAARYRSLHWRELARSVFLDLNRSSQQTLVVSQGLGRALVEAGGDAAKIRTAPNGVSLGAFQGILSAPLPKSLEGLAVVLFFGSLKPWHGIEFLLEAMEVAAEGRPLGLWIVGEGPLGELVQDVAMRGRLPIVHQGAVEHERIPSILAAADVIVAPYTRDAPGYFSPLKIVEAFAAGTPLLASDLPFVRELVGEPAAAHLYEAGNVESFQRALVELLENPSLGHELSVRGKRLAALRHGWSHRAKELIESLGWADRLAERAEGALR